MADRDVALFPLGTVLMPGGRLSLQIFEQRYLTLVRRAMKAECEFGVVLLTQGREVDRPGVNTRFEQTAVTANIVDWDTLQNGLLGIMIEGRQRFSIGNARQQDDGLWLCDASFWEDEPEVPLPEEHAEWTALLQRLAEHPHVQRLGIEVETRDATRLSNQLAQLLPLPESDRYELLTLRDPIDRLDAIHDLLRHYED